MLCANAESGAAKTFASANRSSYQPVVVMNYTSPTTTPPGVTNGGTYYIQNVCSGLYLNLQGNGTANNTPAIQSSLAYNTSQRFKLVRDSSGYYRIQAQNTTAKRVLLLNTSNQVVLSDDCSSSRALWRIKDEGGGQYSFINKATETYAMSNANNGTSGSAVKGEIYSSATQQKWKLYSLNDIQYIHLTRLSDSSGDAIISVTKFYNNDFYYQAYTDTESSELYLLSQANKDWLDSCYSWIEFYANNSESIDYSSVDYKAWMAKKKLIEVIDENDWNVAVDSDEFYGMWMHYTRVEAHYAEAVQLVAQMVDTALIVGTTVYQGIVTVKSIGMLANQKRAVTSLR